MLAEYFKEKDGCEVIENDAGFMAYIISGKQFYIAELYIRPEHRKFEGPGLEIFKKCYALAKEKGCDVFACHVSITTLNATDRINTFSRWGFRLNGHMEGSRLVMVMPVGEGAWAGL